MPNAERLSELVTIVDSGSIAAAANLLGIPRSTLSRRLQALEDDLGIRLLVRDTTNLDLTAAGKRLVARARGIVEATNEAWRSVQVEVGAIEGELRIAIPSNHVAQPLVLAFARCHRQIFVKLMATSGDLDLHADAIDVALQLIPTNEEALTCRQLHIGRSSAVASPEYLEQAGRPTTLSELAEHDAIVDLEDGWRPCTQWPLQDGGTTDVRARFTTNQRTTQLYAALDGMGVALLPEELTAPYVASGQLEPILTHKVGEHTVVNLVYSSRRRLPPQARAFIGFAVHRFGTLLSSDFDSPTGVANGPSES